MTRLTDKARSLIANLEQDDRFKQAAAAAKVAAAEAQELSKRAARRVAQENSWVEARGAVAQLTEIARAHQALLRDLVDRVDALEARAATDMGKPPAAPGGNGSYALRNEGDSSPS